MQAGWHGKPPTLFAAQHMQRDPASVYILMQKVLISRSHGPACDRCAAATNFQPPLRAQAASRRTCRARCRAAARGTSARTNRTFYKAAGLLQRAEAAPAPAERQHLTREALRLMLKARAHHKPLS